MNGLSLQDELAALAWFSVRGGRWSRAFGPFEDPMDWGSQPHLIDITRHGAWLYLELDIYSASNPPVERWNVDDWEACAVKFEAPADRDGYRYLHRLGRIVVARIRRACHGRH